MGSSTTQNISQRQSHTYQKSASSILPKVHGLSRTYQAPSNPPFVHHENEYTESRTLSTRASLPSLHTTMFKQANATSAMLRPSSAHTSKRAVSGMKRLLPLRLATPPLSEDSEDSDSHSTTTSCKRSTFGQLERLGDLSDLGNISQRRLHGTSLLAIRPEKYRDTPIISTDGSPLIGSPLYQQSCTKWDEIECTTSSIIDAYEGLSDSSSSKGCGWDDSNHDTHETQSATLSPLSPRRRHRADSELSFKCLGEENEEVGEGEEGEQSESSWFAGSITPRRVAPRLSTLDIEEWLDDSESSMCESSDDESDDFFACATALAPAKAQVIHVNHKKTQSLSITIPERSIPVGILKHSDSSALRRLTSRSPIKTSPMEDLAMSSPPTSPDEPEAHKFSNFSQRKISRSPADLSPTPASPDTILDIVAAIEECTSNFPTKMLLADTPCISSIRSHLKATSTVSFKSFQRSKQPPAPPAPSTTTLKPPHHKGLNRRNRPQTICLSPTETKSFNFSIPTTPPVTPPFSPDFTFSSLAPSNTPSTTNEGPSPILPTFAYQLAAANLQPLHAIFPVSSDFLRSALYAHILAYIFLQSLPSSTPPSSTPLTRTPTIKHSHSASHSLRKSSFHNTTFSSYTYNNTSLVGIPAKAASTLGLSSSTSIRRNGTLGGGAAASQNKKVELNLKTCIGKLLKGMQGSVDVDGNGKEVEGWVLRSLVEVVRGCEGI